MLIPTQILKNLTALRVTKGSRPFEKAIHCVAKAVVREETHKKLRKDAEGRGIPDPDRAHQYLMEEQTVKIEGCEVTLTATDGHVATRYVYRVDGVTHDPAKEDANDTRDFMARAFQTAEPPDATTPGEVILPAETIDTILKMKSDFVIVDEVPHPKTERADQVRVNVPPVGNASAGMVLTLPADTNEWPPVDACLPNYDTRPPDCGKGGHVTIPVGQAPLADLLKSTGPTGALEFTIPTDNKSPLSFEAFEPNFGLKGPSFSLVTPLRIYGIVMPTSDTFASRYVTTLMRRELDGLMIEERLYVLDECGTWALIPDVSKSTNRVGAWMVTRRGNPKTAPLWVFLATIVNGAVYLSRVGSDGLKGCMSGINCEKAMCPDPGSIGPGWEQPVFPAPWDFRESTFETSLGILGVNTTHPINLDTLESWVRANKGANLKTPALPRDREKYCDCKEGAAGYV